MLKKIAFILSFLLACLALAVFYFVYTYEVSLSGLSSKEAIMNRQNTGVILLDRNGDPFYRFYQGRETAVTPLQQIPLHVRRAVLAAEDKHFYHHNGYSIEATFAALVANIRKQELQYGGSTISQQLIKNSFLSPEKSFFRKYEELILAIELENRYSKDEILEMYLNSVYFGEGAFGVQEAARVYFNTPLAELTESQAAVLAGVLTAPSQLSPISHDPKPALERGHRVIDQMYVLGFLTTEEYKEAKKEKPVFAKSVIDPFPYQAHHFAFEVRRQLVDQYGEEAVARSGFLVHTSIDLSWQAEAEHIVREHVASLASQNVSNGSVIILDPHTGQVRAMIGSVDWSNQDFGKVNITTSLRQPGSSIKPLVYLAALEKGSITPATLLHDVSTVFNGTYRPENYDKRFRGRVTVRRALANSLNIPTVEVQNRIGVASTQDLSKRLGVTTLENFGPADLSISLGAGETKLLEMTTAYATIANQGRYNPATLITKIEDKQRQILYTYEPKNEVVVDSRHAYQITSILSDNQARREVFGTTLTINRPAAVKTGTSSSYKDSLTMGYTPSLVVGVWVGNNDGRPMSNVAGSLGAAPIWRNIIEKLSENMPVEDFPIPKDLTATTVCRSRGLLLPGNFRGTEAVTEYFIPGSEPTRLCFFAQPSPSPSASLEE